MSVLVLENFVLDFFDVATENENLFFYRNIYIVMVTISMFMVTLKLRKDTAVRVSKWLDREIEGYISDKKNKVAFPSKRNFVDAAVLKMLEDKGVKL